MMNTGIRTKSSLSSLISYGKKLKLSHSSTHIKAKIGSDNGDIIINYHSLVGEYMDYLKPILVKHTLSDNDYLKYLYQPKLFCLDTYGDAELWSVLLMVNKMTSIMDFDSKELVLFTDEIFDIINEILILESDNIRYNKIKINE